MNDFRDRVRRRLFQRTTPLLGLACAALVGGCSESKTQGKKPRVELKGVKLTVSIEAGSPLKEALRNGLNDFEAQTGTTIALDERPACDPTADLCVFRGDRLTAYAGFSPLGKPLLESKGLQFAEFPAVYRSCFGVMRDEVVAVPLGIDELVLWHRADLLADPPVRDAHQKRTGAELAAPDTWEKLLSIAETLQSLKKVEFGCALANSGNEGVRGYLAVAGSYAKSSGWSSFAIDTENAKPRLGDAPFERALEIWLKLVAMSPAEKGGSFDDAAARRSFQEGKAAFLISNLAPSVGIRSDGPKLSSEKIGCIQLPGSLHVYAPRTSNPVATKVVNRCAHHGSAGWLVALGNGGNRPAAERLLQFLASPEEGVYLVQAAKRGFVPVRSRLLNEPARFSAFGLPPAAVGRYFAAVTESVRAENWVADFRLPQFSSLETTLAEALALARTGKLAPKAALAKAQRDWESIIEPAKPTFLRQLRESLALPVANL